MNDDARWMGAALALAVRGRGRTAPNPSVGCIIVAGGHVVARGWTQPGGRPHAEAQALAQAGARARGATAYVTLEPCAHVSARGAACADALVAAGVARVVIAATDPDPRTAGAGAARLEAAGIAVTCGVRSDEAAAQNPGFFSRMTRGRPFVTLKLALSLDGCLALADGRSRWITGAAARAHCHRERALADLIMVGRGTFEADDPALDVRLAGLEDRSPRAAVLSSSLKVLPPSKLAAAGATLLRDFAEIDADASILEVFVEGGAVLATELLAADRIDRLLIYRAPVLVGGKPGIGDLGLTDLADAHGRWVAAGTTDLAPDRLEVYLRAPAR
jgi:diaminohydroxyphosphoribosylaminopyrimidine deaminase/5-amino-6-(5-phosphoribosylamino)uracil reductase